jgi:dephospho-CoA kinase
MIVGFCGFKGSGKTTAAKYLISNGWEKVSFKDGLIEEMKEHLPDALGALSSLYAVTTDELFTLKPKVMRELMQNFGTELRRAENKDYWVERWLDSVQGKNRVVVDDVRFLNEAEAVKKNGGIIIRVECTDILTGGEHPSERENLLIKEDFSITVDRGDISTLLRSVDKILNDISDAKDYS